MSKRFTDTSKWLKPWFRKLPPKMKLFWQYILDNCDNSGVIDMDFELASFCIGEEITKDESIEHLSKQIHEFNGSKWFIRDFIGFQYGELSEACKPHKHVIDLMKKHTLLEGYTKGKYTDKEKDKDKDKAKDKEKDKEKSGKFQKPNMEILTMYFQELGYTGKSGEDKAKAFIDHYESCGWVIGPNKKMKDWKATARGWKRRDEERVGTRKQGKVDTDHSEWGKV